MHQDSEWLTDRGPPQPHSLHGGQLVAFACNRNCRVVHFPIEPEIRLRGNNVDNDTSNMHSGLIKSQWHVINAISTTRSQFSKDFDLCETFGDQITCRPVCHILQVSARSLWSHTQSTLLTLMQIAYVLKNIILIFGDIETRVCSILYYNIMWQIGHRET